MKCYKHNESDAVGICCACGKGCCEACASVSETKLVCSQTCSEVMSENRQILERTKMMYGIGQYKPKHTISSQVLIFAFMGVLFLGFGAYWTYYNYRTELGLFMLSYGGFCSVVAVILWYRNRKIKLNC